MANVKALKIMFWSFNEIFLKICEEYATIFRHIIPSARGWALEVTELILIKYRIMVTQNLWPGMIIFKDQSLAPTWQDKFGHFTFYV